MLIEKLIRFKTELIVFNEHTTEKILDFVFQIKNFSRTNWYTFIWKSDKVSLPVLVTHINSQEVIRECTQTDVLEFIYVLR